MYTDVLIAEIGSTTTLVSAFDGLEGEPRFLAQGQAATTVLEGDVRIGLSNAIRALMEIGKYLGVAERGDGAPQELRVAVNGELESLNAALPAALGAVVPGGRVVMMSYQSLEDKIVKSVFAAATASRTPEGLPVELPGHEPEFLAVTRGAERADAGEIDRNPRNAAVQLRAVQRLTGKSRR